jgi:hypothetical protein
MAKNNKLNIIILFNIPSLQEVFFAIENKLLLKNIPNNTFP